MTKMENKEETKVESKSEKPNWVKMKSADLEKIVIDLAKQGESTARIGLILRDTHGIPKAKLLGKKISKIVNEAKITLKTEKEKLNEKIAKLNQHIQKHKHDYSASRSVTKKLWAIQKL